MTSRSLGFTRLVGCAILLATPALLRAQTTVPVTVIPRTVQPATTPAAAKPVVQPDKPVLAAQVIVDSLLKLAAATNRGVFIDFSASWCTWCHKLDAFLKAPEGQALDPYLVIGSLTVQESANMKLFENVGGDTLMKKWGATGGIPYYVFLDKNGVKLADANGMPNGANIGYPGNAAEVKAFGEVLTKGVPKLPEDLRAKMLDYIAKHP